MDALKEGLADMVVGSAGVEVGSAEEPPKKRRRKALASRRVRTTQDGRAT